MINNNTLISTTSSISSIMDNTRQPRQHPPTTVRDSLFLQQKDMINSSIKSITHNNNSNTISNSKLITREEEELRAVPSRTQLPLLITINTTRLSNSRWIRSKTTMVHSPAAIIMQDSRTFRTCLMLRGEAFWQLIKCHLQRMETRINNKVNSQASEWMDGLRGKVIA